MGAILTVPFIYDTEVIPHLRQNVCTLKLEITKPRNVLVPSGIVSLANLVCTEAVKLIKDPGWAQNYMTTVVLRVLY